MTDTGRLPSALYIEPTNRCNSLCTECPRTFGINTESPRDLTLAEFDAIIAQIPTLERVVLHGLGEPLMNPHAPRMVARLRARNVAVTFNSNAILLNRRRGEALIEAGLPELRVSIDGVTRQTYRMMRGVDKLAQVRANLAAFAALKAVHGVTVPRVSLWLVATRQTIEELPLLVEIAPELGATEIYVQRLVYFGVGTAREELAIFGQVRAREQEILARCEKRCRELGLRFAASGAVNPRVSVAQAGGERPWQVCRRPYSLTYITANGNVLSCCFVPFTGRRYAKTILGNVFEQPLAEIWHGARYQAFRAHFESAEPPQWCAGCGSNWSV
ncbi:MAG TPA: radical SAM protein [Chloroflexota bacterium]|nr:radical SAM protein [Chloroflexota bacterium]